MVKYVMLEKQVGETPLQAVELYRSQHAELLGVPMAYAGRLDPMASGKLLVLIGEECKHQEKYHALDKEYEFSVLLGVSSDTGDVLGLLSHESPKDISDQQIKSTVEKLSGTTVTLPYPHFSSKTVKGKPLHVWTLEGRLGEIEIPTISSKIHSLTVTGTQKLLGTEIYNAVIEKISLIPTVTEESKALGKDFRRVDVRASWKGFLDAHIEDTYTIVTLRCIASSGTYMRSLAGIIGEQLSTKGLAYSIHRSKMGVYKVFGPLSLWIRKY